MSKKILTSGLFLAAFICGAKVEAKATKVSFGLDVLHQILGNKQFDADIEHLIKTKGLDGEEETKKALYNLLYNANGMQYGAETGVRATVSYGKEFGDMTISAQLGLGTDLYSKERKIDKIEIKNLDAAEDAENALVLDEKSKTLSDSDKKLSFKFSSQENDVSIKTDDGKIVVKLDLDDETYTGTWNQTKAVYAAEKSANLDNAQKVANYLFTQWVKQSITPATADDAMKKKINELATMGTPTDFDAALPVANGFVWAGSITNTNLMLTGLTGGAISAVSVLNTSPATLGNLIQFINTTPASIGAISTNSKDIKLVEGDLAKGGKLTAAGLAKVFPSLASLLEVGDAAFDRSGTGGLAITPVDLAKPFFGIGQQLKIKGEGVAALDAPAVKLLTGKDAEATKAYFLIIAKDANGAYTAQIMTGDDKIIKAFGQELTAAHLGAKVHEATHDVESMVELSALKKRRLISVDLSAVFERKIAKKFSIVGALGGAYAYNSTTADFVLKTKSDSSHKATADMVVGEAVTFASLLEDTRDISIDAADIEKAMENAEDAAALGASATDATGAMESKESVKLRNSSVGLRTEMAVKYDISDTFAVKFGITGEWMYQLEMKQVDSKDSDGKTKEHLFKFAKKKYTKKHELALGLVFGFQAAM